MKSCQKSHHRKFLNFTSWILAVIGIVSFTTTCFAGGFADDFTLPSSSLSAWEKINPYSYGNAEIISDSTGKRQLKYSITPQSQPFQDTPAGGTIFPGLKLSRPFTGSNWIFETKVGYHIQDSTFRARTFVAWICFGSRDNSISFRRRVKQLGIGSHYNEMKWVVTVNGGVLQQGFISDTSTGQYYLPDVYYLRVIRKDKKLNVFWSTDKITWKQLGSEIQLSDEAASQPQFVMINGGEIVEVNTYNGILDTNSYALYDYAKVAPIPIVEKVAIYFRSVLSGKNIPGYPTTDGMVTVRAIVWADDGNGMQPYTSEEITDTDKWHAPGVEGPFEDLPTLKEKANKIFVWPSNWPVIHFDWTKLEHHASSAKDKHNRKYWYTEFPIKWVNNPEWGGELKLFSGTFRVRVKATINKDTSEEQSKESPDKEKATRFSVLNNTAPDDPYGGSYVKWLTAYLNVGYEWGGWWFGGLDSNGAYVGGGEPSDDYDGYGIDCSGLVTNAARRAGYKPFAGEKHLGTGQLSESKYSKEITNLNELKPGDILISSNHVATIYNRSSDKIDLIEATPNGNRVKTTLGQSLKKMMSLKFKPRRLNNE